VHGVVGGSTRANLGPILRRAVPPAVPPSVRRRPEPGVCRTRTATPSLSSRGRRLQLRQAARFMLQVGSFLFSCAVGCRRLPCGLRLLEGFEMAHRSRGPTGPRWRRPRARHRHHNTRSSPSPITRELTPASQSAGTPPGRSTICRGRVNLYVVRRRLVLRATPCRFQTDGHVRVPIPSILRLGLAPLS
jgi:hypothetical protein